MALLEKIKSPDDLRNLKLDDLEKLCEEIRSRIVDVVSGRGGHLAASLGVCELTVILHYVFDTPKDKIVFDVGHQCYVHKIITGRNDKFDMIRQYNGICGFPSIVESVYDSFNVGHASTAVSAALGMAVARDLKGENFKVIAIIGDGSLTGGLTYEGLNNAGHLNKDIIVVLNDNAMFISHAVGAVAKMLVRILTLGLVKKIEKNIEKFSRRLHFFGAFFLKVAKRFKLLFFPGMLFEEMGFAYIGPIDGHDLREMYNVFKNVKHFRGPILVHVLTKKGKGFAPSENCPSKYHGIGKFDKITGKLLENNNKISFTKVFSEVITKLASENEKIVGITAAMTDGCGLEKFAEKFKNRFYDVGIAEEHAVTFAAGLACEGFIPVCAIYSTFLQRSYDQIIHDVALTNLHVIFMIDRAGLVGEDGPTHHGSFDISYLRIIPNMKIMVPKDGRELRDMFYSALSMQGPVAIRYPKDYILDQEQFTVEEFKEIELGKCEVINDISDASVVIIACGPVVYIAKEIVDELKLKIGIINIRFIKPLDEDILRKIKAEKIITIEENTILGGLFGAISEFYAQNKICKKMLPIGLPDSFVTFGENNVLKKLCRLDKENIKNSIKNFLNS